MCVFSTLGNISITVNFLVFSFVKRKNDRLFSFSKLQSEGFKFLISDSKIRLKVKLTKQIMKAQRGISRSIDLLFL